jgi:hypothetical protein
MGLSALPGCGFPDLTYETGGDAAVGDATADAHAPDDAAGDTPTSDAATPRDGPTTGDAAPDVIEAPDATHDAPETAPDAGPEAGIDCDEDHDGYRALSCDGGNDCCDTDPNAHPTQAMFFGSQDKCLSWDYNCDGKVETEFLVNITCSGTGLTGCKGGPGFTSEPACGAMAPYSTCVGSGALACTASSTMMATQACN